MNHLFAPVRINKLELKNRLVMPAMGTNFGAGEGYISDHNINHYCEKARNGMGLVIVEAMYMHPSGSHRKKAMALTEDKFIPGLRKFTDAVHAAGGKIAAQIAHAGRIVSHRPEGYENMSASNVPQRITGVVPHALSVAEIAEFVADFGSAARRAKDAGFDAVEIHGGHGYLVMQFISPLWNKRLDEYGGSRENRVRFPVEIVREIRRRVGPDFPVIFRLSYDELIPGGQSPEDSLELAQKLVAAGADALHVSQGNNETPDDMRRVIGTMYENPGHILYAAEAMKKAVKVPVIAVGRLGNPALAEAAVATGKADLVSLGRSVYADPEWAKKVREGRADQIIPCIACNAGCIERLNKQETITCAQNPLLGRNLYEIPPAAVKKNILVIGAGLAGLEVALRAAQRGHRVRIWEKNAFAGGQAALAARSPGKEVFLELVNSRIRRLRDLGVEVEYGKSCAVADVKNAKFDQAVIAVGGKPIRLQGEWMNSPLVVDTWKLLLESRPVAGNPGAVVIGGGSIGLETAHMLADHGYRTTVIELFDNPGGNVVPTVRAALVDELRRCGVQIITNAAICDIKGNSVFFLQNGQRREIANVALVAPAVGVVPDDAFFKELTAAGVPALAVGNCANAGNALDVAMQACDIGLSL